MKKTLVKSILLAIFGMMVVQNVNAQKISAGEEVATNIGPGLGANDYFYVDNILYQVVTPVANDNYEAKAVAFFGESLPAEIEIIGGGQANNCTFTVTEIEALDGVKTMSGTSYVAGDAAALDAITTLIFVKEDGFGGFAGTIGAEAFANLDNLEYIYTELTTPPTADEDAFTELDYDNITLTVPADAHGQAAGKYITATGWDVFYQLFLDGDSVYPFGDVNKDKKVNQSDVKALSNAVGEEEYDDINPIFDFNGDGKSFPNQSDVKALRNLVSNF